MLEYIEIQKYTLHQHDTRQRLYMTTAIGTEKSSLFQVVMLNSVTLTLTVHESTHLEHFH
jgi:hypothetical protein